MCVGAHGAGFNMPGFDPAALRLALGCEPRPDDAQRAVSLARARRTLNEGHALPRGGALHRQLLLRIQVLRAETSTTFGSGCGLSDQTLESVALLLGFGCEEGGVRSLQALQSRGMLVIYKAASRWAARPGLHHDVGVVCTHSRPVHELREIPDSISKSCTLTPNGSPAAPFLTRLPLLC